MNFQEAEKAYHDLRAQYSAGKLSSTDFEDQVSKLKLQDVDGRWWQIGVQSGEWYVHDGQKWAKSHPPAASDAPATPPSPPEGPGDATAPAIPAMAPVPMASSKEPRAGGLAPRFFSTKPAGRGAGGLPTPVLIGIIALVAVIGIAAVVGAFLFVSGQLGGSGTAAKPITTPTLLAVVSPPTAVVPTLPPVIPTVAPSPTALAIAVPTAAITPTNVAVTGTVAAPRATATRRPTGVTPAAPTPTKTVAVAPGIYVTKVQVDPPAPNFNEPVGFKLTMLNTTGNMVRYKWLVKIFKCSQDPCASDDFRKSFGETTNFESNIGTGTVELATTRTWSSGQGACTYVAMPHYYDPANGQVLPFLQTNGQPIYYVFRLCH